MDPETQTLRSLYLEFDKLDAWLTVKKRVQIPLSLFDMFNTKPTRQLKLTFPERRVLMRVYSYQIQVRCLFPTFLSFCT